MKTYERVLARVDGGRRSVYLQDPRETTILGATVLVGTEVKKDGESVLRNGNRMRIIDLSLISKRTPMKMNNFYGWLEVSHGNHEAQI